MKRLVGSTAIALSVSLSLASGLAGSAAAQQKPCGEREQIVSRLGDKYGEARTARGLSHNNGMVEVYASEETGTWTILITLPNGETCLVAAGDFWENAPLEVTQSKQAI
ncbi:hypothetical protein [Algicella marina]|uniref:Uncharacterized protein n=1 Tax=Algicella marina TaxID=2683284 RepID=A0A6P1T4S4_9RHOB|nr:hypothetical protein [Algicella marina]QHQ36269.1 hypothetical protein GO499_14355 [Algicella marina]